MAKIGLSNITTGDTFQIWLDTTNDIIDLLGTDVITASVGAGDVTGSLAGPKNATLIGNFNANTIIANTLLKADKISSASSTSITMQNPTIVESTTRVAFEVLSTSTDPIIRVNNGVLAWDVGLDTDSQSFIINTGAGQDRFKLNSAGDLTIPGNFSCDEITVTVINSNLNGDVYASDGVNKIVENGTNGTDATFTGNLTGDVYSSGGVKILENGTNGTDATFTGNVTGDVSGNVTGNVSGNLSGNVTGNVSGNLTGNVTGDVSGNVTGTVSDITNHLNAVIKILDSAGTVVNTVYGASANT